MPARILNQSEEINDYSHYENEKHFAEKLRKEKKASINPFLEFGNPLLENEGGEIPLHLFENLSETIGKTRMNI